MWKFTYHGEHLIDQALLLLAITFARKIQEVEGKDSRSRPLRTEQTPPQIVHIYPRY